ncbi:MULTISPECIES: hypothetical protein [unclassified Imperialibacter]|uniref:hypothetical protein n=1 Tax=unclassified Imperialibacter TaxID=2629706 RepID=UPI0012573DA7|nr:MULTISPECIES: hypothetical protein [unclassified Imperialibacter]CAD5246143.1 conserved hypothetical protein [Imperialibacter sp. 75]CAD5246167.1 conserved hypothetical protein [Imperialibacter sp. 89]VVS95996.1 conserved hypothetical protein [Imperialibacter sp. EC-SDR9]
MSLLIRKINRAKWPAEDVDYQSDVSADAITNCLKTTRNTLSVWQIDTEDDLEKAVLAIASNLQHLETIDVVILEEKHLSNYNIKIVATPGKTPLEELVHSHRDLEELTFMKLGTIKDHIVERIQMDKFKRFTRTALKQLIEDAINTGKLKLEDLNPSIREKI